MDSLPSEHPVADSLPTAPSSGAHEHMDEQHDSGRPTALQDQDGEQGVLQQIGEYLVRRLVGEGGMGRVYEAEERLSKRRVSLKVLRDELSRSPEARALFLDEAKILAHLEHPNIVRSLASLEVDGKLVTVLEYLDGRTLRQLLVDRGQLGWEEAAYVVTCVARALTAAHGQEPPVIHRDLEPENIMVLADGSVKVMDFGVAKLVQELNQTSTQSVGALRYMSPEQIDAQTVDQRSDLYCLGLVFYELLCGRPPFASSSPRKLLDMQCTVRPPDLDDTLVVPKGIEELLFGLLEKDPDERPRSASAVVERLEPFLPARQPATLAEAPIGGGRAPSERDSSGDDGARRGEGQGRRNRAAKTREGHGGKRREGEVKGRGRRDGKGKAKGGGALERRGTEAPLVEASAPRELSTVTSLAIIVLLALVSALVTYLYRGSQASPAAPPAMAEP